MRWIEHQPGRPQLLNFNCLTATRNPESQILLSSAPSQLPIGESTYASPATYREDQYTANVDHALTSKNEISERFFYSRAPTAEPFSPNAANVPGWGPTNWTRMRWPSRRTPTSSTQTW